MSSLQTHWRCWHKAWGSICELGGQLQAQWALYSPAGYCRAEGTWISQAEGAVGNSEGSKCHLPSLIAVKTIPKSQMILKNQWQVIKWNIVKFNPCHKRPLRNHQETLVMFGVLSTWALICLITKPGLDTRSLNWSIRTLKFHEQKELVDHYSHRYLG